MVNRGGTTGKLGHLPLQRRLRDQYGEHADGDAHLFPPEDVYKSAKRKQFYRILGQASSMRVDLSQHTVEVNDLILLCTNGLWHMLQDDKLAEILAQGGDGSATSLIVPRQASHKCSTSGCNSGRSAFRSL